MSVNYELIGRRIREERKFNQWSQLMLAEKAEVSGAYISQIENGKKKVSLSCLIEIARALDVTVDELLSGNQMPVFYEYQNEMDEILTRCSAYEKRMIFDMASSLFESLKKNVKLLEEDKGNA